MDNKVKRVWSFLTSKKLAIYLIATLTLVTAIGSLVPQESYRTPDEVANWLSAHPGLEPLIKSLGLQHFYTTWWYQGIALIFGLNILACTVKQFAIQTRRGKISFLNKDRSMQQKNSYKVELGLEKNESVKYITNLLEKSRFKVYKNKDKDLFLAVKYSWGRWSLPVFHVSLIIILVSAVVSSLFTSRGVVEITEGQTLQENHQTYRYIIEGPLFNEAHGNFNFTLQKLEVIYPKSGPPDNAYATLLFQDDQGKTDTQVLHGSQEGDYQGFNFYLDKFSYAPLLILKDAKGNVLVGNYYNLTAVDTKEGQQYKEKISFQQANVEVSAALYPDISDKGNYHPVNPGMAVEIISKDSGQPIFSGNLRFGQSIKFKGYKLEFPELRQFGEFIVVKDLGAKPMFLGFLLMIVSLLIYFLFVPQQIWFTIESVDDDNSRLTLGGSKIALEDFLEKGEAVQWMKERR